MADLKRTITKVTALRNELPTLPLDTGSSEWKSWHTRVETLLRQTFGDEHTITKNFVGIMWGPLMLSSGQSREELEASFRRSFLAGAEVADGVLQAALDVLEEETEPADAAEPKADYAPDLWEHVQNLVEAEKWSQVASQTAIYVEATIRRQTGRSREEVGKRLMTNVFGTNGAWQLGHTEGEREGWKFLAMGFVQALGNVDRHRLDERTDAKRYALGVLGLGSLLLTQLRHKYGDALQQ